MTQTSQKVTVTLPLNVKIYDSSLIQSYKNNTNSVEQAVQKYLEKVIRQAKENAPDCESRISIVSQTAPLVSVYLGQNLESVNEPSPELRLNGNAVALAAIESAELNQADSTDTKRQASTESSSFSQQISFIVTLMGPPVHVYAVRGALLRENPSQVAVLLKASARIMLLPGSRELKSFVRDKFQLIKSETNTQITILGQHYLNEPNKVQPPPGLGSEADNAIDIEIAGVWENVQNARIKVLVALDEFSGLASSCMAIDPKLHPLIAGIKRVNITDIMYATNTTIYIPTPLSGNISNSTSSSDSTTKSFSHTLLYITGADDDIEQAKKMLMHRVDEVKPYVQYKSVQCLPRKIEWLLLYCKQCLVRLMQDNAVYIVLPMVGSQSNVIYFYGTTLNSIERAIKSSMQIVFEIYISCIQLSSPLSANQLNDDCARISQESGAEILLKSNYIEIYGLEANVKQAYLLVTSLLPVKKLLRDTKFQIELGLDQKEFIEGKKMGKINKITAAADCKIAFHDKYNEFNMLIDVIHAAPAHALQGLELLQAELPAEISFCVPEVHHKRIIGISGKNIQKIMKKFGVYVKFSNRDEHEKLGGYYDNKDNVIARTPAKNAVHLKGFKQAITELIYPNQAPNIDEFTEVPLDFHRIVIGHDGTNLHQISSVTKTEIFFPAPELGSQTVRIYGQEASVKKAKAMLQELIPQVIEILVQASETARHALNSADFKEGLRESLHQFNVTLHVRMGLSSSSHTSGETMKPTLASSPSASPSLKNMRSETFSIFLYYYPASSKLNAARETLLQYLNRYRIVPITSASSNNVLAANGENSVSNANAGANTNGMRHIASNDSIHSNASYDSFAHFNSKLLAPVSGTSSVAKDMHGDALPLLTSSLPTGAGSNFFQQQSESFNAPSFNKSLAGAGNFKNIRDIFQNPPSAMQLLAGSPEVSPKTSPKTSFMPNSNISNPSPLGKPSYINRPARGHTIGDSRAVSIQYQLGQPHESNVTVNFGTFASRRESLSAWGESGMSSISNDGVAASIVNGLGLDKFSEALSQNTDDSSMKKATSVQDFAILTAESAHEIYQANENALMDKLLDTLGLEKYKALFEQEEIDLATFTSFNEQDLKDVGVGAFGARKKMVLAIADLKQYKSAIQSTGDVFASNVDDSVSKQRRRSNSAVNKSVQSRPIPAPNVRL